VRYLFLFGFFSVSRCLAPVATFFFADFLSNCWTRRRRETSKRRPSFSNVDEKRRLSSVDQWLYFFCYKKLAHVEHECPGLAFVCVCVSINKVAATPSFAVTFFATKKSFKMSLCATSCDDISNAWESCVNSAPSYKTFLHRCHSQLGVDRLARLACKTFYCFTIAFKNVSVRNLAQGILKGEVSLYHWPPVWPVWISLFCK
jgi:hypothetical protein